MMHLRIYWNDPIRDASVNGGAFLCECRNCCNNPCFRDRKLRALCTVSFGLGMVLAQISPEGLVLFIAAVILVALGVAVLRTL